MRQGLSRLIVLLAILALALPASAMAQSPTNDQYDDSSVTFLGGSGAPGDPSDPGTGTGTGTGSLPFSGLDAVLLGAMGGGLVLLGVGMRRLTGVPEEAA